MVFVDLYSRHPNVNMDNVRDGYMLAMLFVAKREWGKYETAAKALNALMHTASNQDEYNLGFAIGNYMFDPVHSVG